MARNAVDCVHASANAFRARHRRLTGGSSPVVSTLALYSSAIVHTASAVVAGEPALAELERAVADTGCVRVEAVVVSVTLHVANTEWRLVVQNLTSSVTVAVNTSTRII